MRIFKSIYIIALIGFIWFLGFSTGCDESGFDASELSIHAADFINIDIDSNTVIMDVRTEEEYAEGYVKNAVLLDVNSSDFNDQAAKLNKDLTYYVYCRTGRRSLIAVKYFRSIGILNSYSVEGGILELVKHDIEIVKQ